MKECIPCNVVLEDEAEALQAGLDITKCFKCGGTLTEQ